MLQLVEQYRDELNNRSVEEIIYYFLDKYQENIALASSLGAEDQVLADIIIKYKPDARIFLIDTGMLNNETYELLNETSMHYKKNIEIYYPDSSEVEGMIKKYGKELYYESIELRKKCCHIRKINPLLKVLNTVSVWITGQRRDQSITRKSINVIEWDEVNNLIKLNPLADWSEEMVWNYIKKNNIPYNKLHDQGYRSIGCAPCTRAVSFGEDVRSGRWWWEEPEHKECGLHQRTIAK